jgi:hypothetical protein
VGDHREVLVKADEGNFVRFHTSDGVAVLRGTQMKLPRRFVACFPDDRGGPELHLRFEVRAGIPQCREVFLQSHPEGREVRQADIRSADLELYLEIACQMVAPHVSALPVLGEDGLEYPKAVAGNTEVARGVARARRNTRRQLSDDRLPEVADVYRANPSRPSAAVAEHFGLEARTARLYVRRARDAALLEEVSNRELYPQAAVRQVAGHRPRPGRPPPHLHGRPQDDRAEVGRRTGSSGRPWGVP